MDLYKLFKIAKDSKDYTCFCMELGQIIGIPPTDARCNDIQIDDLLDKNFKPNELKGVSNNEQKKEFIGCTCKQEDKHGWTTVKCCNECGKPIEDFWVRQ